jgi:hypothetical protein
MTQGLPTRRLTRSSSPNTAIIIITIIITTWCLASLSSRPIVVTIITTTITTAAITATDRGRGQSMIPKSGCRFSEKIMLHQNAKAQSIHYEAIAL